MARTREFDPADVIEKAVALFHQRGYNDTSMDDLVKFTGVSRYGIYGEFGNKRELFIRALEHFSDRFFAEQVQDLVDPDAELAHIRAFFQRLEEHAREDELLGCFMCNTAMELARQDKIIGEIIRGKFEIVRHAILNALKNSMKLGTLKIKQSPEAYASYLSGVQVAMATMIKSEFPEEQMQQFLAVALAELNEE